MCKTNYTYYSCYMTPDNQFKYHKVNGFVSLNDFEENIMFVSSYIPEFFHSYILYYYYRN
jgi:hypothetical protein